MKIGIWKPYKEVLSVSIYKQHVGQYLKQYGHTLIDISPDFRVLPDVEVIWDATCTGGKSPSYKLLNTRIPIVVTLHGAANYILPKALQIHQSGARKRWLLYKHKFLWWLFARKVEKVITVSQYAKKEITKIFPISPSIIFPIHHGYDAEHFFYDDKIEKKIWLHVSAYQPKKNVNKIIEAYAKIEDNRKPELVIVSKGYVPKIPLPLGVTLYTEGRDSRQLSELYRQASVFIFPSIHETFGMPLIEAMACGCAIITSNTTSCVEIAADKGLCVDPYNVDALSEAMHTMLSPEKEAYYRTASLSRAKDFSWQKCGDAHEKIFIDVVRQTLTQKL